MLVLARRVAQSRQHANIEYYSMRRSGAPLRFGLFAACLVVGVASISALPFMRWGLPLADDTDTHLSYLQAIVHEISLGDDYPRWLPTLNQGRGSPIFFLQYPLPYIATLVLYAPLHLLAGGGVSSIAVPLSGAVTVLLLALSGWTSYLWLRSFASRAAALAGAVVFLWAPYHVGVDVFRRWSLGEIAGYAAFPLVCLFSRRIATAERWPRNLAGFAVAFTLLAASHMITAIMIMPLSLLETWLAGGRRSQRRHGAPRGRGRNCRHSSLGILPGYFRIALPGSSQVRPGLRSLRL